MSFTRAISWRTSGERRGTKCGQTAAEMLEQFNEWSDEDCKNCDGRSHVPGILLQF